MQDPPFASEDPVVTFQKISKGLKRKMNPSERLACRAGGAVNVKHHDWFSGFDWAKLREMEPPYRPQVMSNEDITSFDALPSDKPQPMRYVDPGDNWDAEFEDIVGPAEFES